LASNKQHHLSNQQMPQQETTIFYPSTTKAWRRWLEKNHLSKQAVWVVFYRKNSGRKTITWSESVDEALCFGWIDSKKIKIDDETSHQFFSKRKAKSTWSKINKEKVERLIKSGAMTKAGYDAIDTAKQNGSWSVLDEVEELVIPKDLAAAFKKHSGSSIFFSGLSKSVKKGLLQWLVLAKRSETREKRITEIATLAAIQQKPKPF
jgi:uncharacterized protein YdeI (YjbR/CyaY-like superfamily)